MKDVPDLDQFDHADALRIGQELAQRCLTAGHRVVICLWLGEQLVFTAALPGTSACNNRWAERKANIVRHLAQPSMAIEETFGKDDPLGFLTTFGLDPADYFPAGGAVPITVRGSMVGVLAVSGLASEDDHDLAVSALEGVA